MNGVINTATAAGVLLTASFTANAQPVTASCTAEGTEVTMQFKDCTDTDFLTGRGKGYHCLPATKQNLSGLEGGKTSVADSLKYVANSQIVIKMDKEDTGYVAYTITPEDGPTKHHLLHVQRKTGAPVTCDINSP